jgi:photosystem I reaction center subunit V
MCSGCTVGALALGRFVFLPFHRASLARAGMPTQDGKTHAEAGDDRAQEASFVLKTNDPAGGCQQAGGGKGRRRSVYAAHTSSAHPTLDPG